MNGKVAGVFQIALNKLKSINIWGRYFTAKQQVLLGLIVCIGIILRAINILKTQLWRDEGYIILTAFENSFIKLLFQQHWDTAHPPLYFMLLRLLLHLGKSPWFLRSFSLLISSLSLYLLPVLAKKIDPKSKNFPFILLITFSLSLTQLTMGILVRTYSLEVFFMILSLMLAFGFIGKSNNSDVRMMVLFPLVNFLMFFTDYGGVWVIMGYWIFAIISFRSIKQNSKFILSLFFTSVLCLIWSPFLIKNLNQAIYLERALLPNFVGRSFNEIISRNIHPFNFFTGTAPCALGSSCSINAFTTLSLYTVVGLRFLKGALSKSARSLFLFILYFIPVAISFTLSLMFTPIFAGHNLIIVNIVFIVGISLIISQIDNIVLSVVFVFLVSVNVLFNYPKLMYFDPAYDWQKAAQIVFAANKEKDVWILSPDQGWMYVMIKYYNFLGGQRFRVRINELKTTKPSNLRGALIFFMKAEPDQKHNASEFEFVRNYLKCESKRYLLNYLYLEQCQRKNR